jgi:hypothetical protein
MSPEGVGKTSKKESTFFFFVHVVWACLRESVGGRLESLHPTFFSSTSTVSRRKKASRKGEQRNKYLIDEDLKFLPILGGLFGIED